MAICDLGDYLDAGVDCGSYVGSGPGPGCPGILPGPLIGVQPPVPAIRGVLGPAPVSPSLSACSAMSMEWEPRVIQGAVVMCLSGRAEQRHACSCIVIMGDAHRGNSSRLLCTCTPGPIRVTVSLEKENVILIGTRITGIIYLPSPDARSICCPEYQELAKAPNGIQNESGITTALSPPPAHIHHRSPGGVVVSDAEMLVPLSRPSPAP